MTYFLFAGESYYPSGGARDWLAQSADLATLIAKGQEQYDRQQGTARFKMDERFAWRYDWWHIADESMKIVENSHDYRIASGLPFGCNGTPQPVGILVDLR